jgi:hypothetical protein
MFNATKYKWNLMKLSKNKHKIWTMVIIHVVGETWKTKRLTTPKEFPRQQ